MIVSRLAPVEGLLSRRGIMQLLPVDQIAIALIKFIHIYVYLFGYVAKAANPINLSFSYEILILVKVLIF